VKTESTGGSLITVIQLNISEKQIKTYQRKQNFTIIFPLVMYYVAIFVAQVMGMERITKEGTYTWIYIAL
jgi:hypothetical protein